MHMSEAEATTPQELLQQIHAFIAVTREHVGTDAEVDLSGLDDKVQQLCEAVLDMPKPEADQYTDALQTLAEELTVLKSGMEQAQTGVREQIDALNLRHKAVKAYKTTEADTYKKKPE